MINQNCCIIFFVKYPMPGKVKTRLARKTGLDFACELYKNFILDILNQIKSVQIPVFIAVDDKQYINYFRQWLDYDFQYIYQKGDNLGARMKNAFINIFHQGYNQAMIIGSDIPELTADIIENAIKSLQLKSAVIGPTEDGGYYLIGLNAEINVEPLFHGIPWSTSNVYELTLKKFSENKINYSYLSTLSDIDTYEDLIKYYDKNKKQKGLKTIDFLRENFNFLKDK